MSLPPFSEKRLREMAKGIRNRDGSKKITVADIRAKNDAFSKKMHAILNGKEEKAPNPRKGVKDSITYPMAEKMLDAAFSQWVRLKSADEHGTVRCFICGKPMRWQRSVLMHFQSRTCIAIQWDEVGCQAGCRECNGKPNGDRERFAERLDGTYGQGTSAALTIKSKGTGPDGEKLEVKFDINYLLTLARFYRERIEWIRLHEPRKFST